jgi:hypothetical protein
MLRPVQCQPLKVTRAGAGVGPRARSRPQQPCEEATYDSRHGMSSLLGPR